MSRRLALVLAIVALAAGEAAANGRYPATKSVTFREGSDTDMIVGLTFGAVITHDDGAHWWWICEQSIGYGGPYDPIWHLTADDGTIYAATHDGLAVSRDGGCSFQDATLRDFGHPSRLDSAWIGGFDVASNGTLWIATSETGLPNAVYRSTNGGETFVKVGLESSTTWWKSLHVAPTDPLRIYVSGYRVAPSPQVFVYRSIDGGMNWTELPTTGVELSTSPLVLVAGVDPADADIVYLRSVGSAGVGRDRLYRSSNGGSTWTEVLLTDRPMLAFTILGDGDILAGGTTKEEDGGHGCLWRSEDRGETFTGCEVGPQIECLGARRDGQIFACGSNWGPDWAAVSRFSGADLPFPVDVTWRKAFTFDKMSGPLQCPAGTPQHDICELQLWPGIREEYWTTDAGPEPADDAGSGSGGCCDGGGGGGAGAGLFALALGFLIKRRSCARSPSSG